MIPLDMFVGNTETHYMILSSAGVSVLEGIVDESNKHRARLIYSRGAMGVLKTANVLHNGMDWRNLFYNPIIDDFVLIDFSNAYIY